MKKIAYIILLFALYISCHNPVGYDELIKKGTESVKQKKYSLAYTYFQEAWFKDSTKVEANYWLACIYSKKCYSKNSDKKNTSCLITLKYLDKAINIDKTYKLLFEQRADLKMKIEDYSGSLDDFNQAALLHPTDTNIFIYRAFVKQKLNDKNGTCADLLKAIQLGSISAKAKYTSICKLDEEK
jgi:hypothetical protein